MRSSTYDKAGTMKITTTFEESIVIMQVEGSLSSEEKIDFEKEMNRQIESGHHLILDLSKVSFIDSTTLGLIVKYYSIFRTHGRHLLLSSINRQIFEVFHLTGITKQVRIFETSQAAAEYIRSA